MIWISPDRMVTEAARRPAQVQIKQHAKFTIALRSDLSLCKIYNCYRSHYTTDEIYSCFEVKFHNKLNLQSNIFTPDYKSQMFAIFLESTGKKV